MKHNKILLLCMQLTPDDMIIKECFSITKLQIHVLVPDLLFAIHTRLSLFYVHVQAFCKHCKKDNCRFIYDSL